MHPQRLSKLHRCQVSASSAHFIISWTWGCYWTELGVILLPAPPTLLKGWLTGCVDKSQNHLIRRTVLNNRRGRWRRGKLAGLILSCFSFSTTVHLSVGSLARPPAQNVIPFLFIDFIAGGVNSGWCRRGYTYFISQRDNFIIQEAMARTRCECGVYLASRKANCSCCLNTSSQVRRACLKSTTITKPPSACCFLLARI